jgi:hypothetical protein
VPIPGEAAYQHFAQVRGLTRNAAQRVGDGSRAYVVPATARRRGLLQVNVGLDDEGTLSADQ